MAAFFLYGGQGRSETRLLRGRKSNIFQLLEQKKIKHFPTTAEDKNS